MTPEDYEAAFHGIDLPKKMELATGVNVADVPEFIKASIYLLRTSGSTRVTEMVRFRLNRALEIINASDQNNL